MLPLQPTGRLMVVALLTMLALLTLTGCERGRASADATAPGGEATVTTPADGALANASPTPDAGLFDGVELPSIIGDDNPPPPPDDLAVAQFSNLRFATTGEGEAQASFPATTEEMYAIWDYAGMEGDDTFTRKWFRNDALEVEHVDEAWDYLTYGSTGTVRDIYLYDYVDGIDAGRWRVELYVNGTLQTSAEFDVQ
ncbi:MAG: hypothetical protein KDD73_14210 [Anaerolineales bacterium]|nr:hypothetical protein [Anaerolineales bacterium]MCB9127978.1 hypothetical protein [Ardenticatenales bacterium]MCB9171994.1 hypothetical protein [Ardenticatenales bacterium]